MQKSGFDYESIRDDVDNLYSSMFNQETTPVDEMENEIIQKIYNVIFQTAATLSAQDRTSKLWINYFHQVDIIRQFIRSERTGNWELHLDAMRAMLPVFHAAGHHNYAKSTHLYLQEMEDLHMRLDAETFHKFTKEGYFVNRRFDRYWCGVPIDLTIEQDLMRSLKTGGGLSRGRGITESTLAKWTPSTLTHFSPGLKPAVFLQRALTINLSPWQMIILGITGSWDMEELFG